MVTGRHILSATTITFTAIGQTLAAKYSTDDYALVTKTLTAVPKWLMWLAAPYSDPPLDRLTVTANIGHTLYVDGGITASI